MGFEHRWRNDGKNVAWMSKQPWSHKLPSKSTRLGNTDLSTLGSWPRREVVFHFCTQKALENHLSTVPGTIKTMHPEPRIELSSLSTENGDWSRQRGEVEKAGKKGGWHRVVSNLFFLWAGSPYVICTKVLCVPAAVKISKTCWGQIWRPSGVQSHQRSRSVAGRNYQGRGAWKMNGIHI